MAQFKEVFSTTVKVLLALLLIALIAAVGIGILGGIVSLGTGDKGFKTQAEKDAEAEVNRIFVEATGSTIKTAEESEAYRTTMPKSVWDRGLARAFNHHCYIRGMTKDEVLRALGQPQEKTDTLWTWRKPGSIGKCLKHTGESCAQREAVPHVLVFFTRNGYVDESLDECQALSGDYIPNSNLFAAPRK